MNTYNKIPDELNAHNDWCLWGSNKVPINPKTGKAARPNDPNTFSDFYTAEDVYLHHSDVYQGLGVLTGGSDNLCAIDIDQCFDDGLPNLFAMKLISTFNSYTEVSQSGHGIHILFTVDWSKVFDEGEFIDGIFTRTGEKFSDRYGNKNTKLSDSDCKCLEFYPSKHFVALTGDVFSTNESWPLRDCSDLLANFLNQYFLKEPVSKRRGVSNQKSNRVKDFIKSQGKDYIFTNIKKSKYGNQFLDLYQTGNWQKYQRVTDERLIAFPSESEARWFMINQLLFFTGLNEELTIELFENSQLYLNSNKANKRRNLTVYEVRRALNSSNGKYFEPKIEDLFENHVRSLGVDIRWNDLTNRMEYQTPEKDPRFDIPRHKLDEAMPTILLDEFKKLDVPLPFSEKSLVDHINLIGYRNHYNPVHDYLKDECWDKRDRFPELFKILRIDEPTKENQFNQLLIKRWFYQATQVVFNQIDDIKKTNGMLIFTGAGGIGKTTFFQKITPNPDWFCSFTNSFNPNNKDCKAQLISHWIVEIGEIDESIPKEYQREDTTNLKGFVTEDKIEIRWHYGRRSEEMPRLVALAGSSNKSQFITTSAGFRRWWIVDLKHGINQKALNVFCEPDNLRQFWSQCYTEGSVPGSYDFTEDELEQLKQHVLPFMESLVGEDIIRDSFDWYLDKDFWRWQTAGQVYLSDPNIERNISSDRQVGKILRKLETEGLTESRRVRNRLQFLIPPNRDPDELSPDEYPVYSEKELNRIIDEEEENVTLFKNQSVSDEVRPCSYEDYYTKDGVLKS